jgi:hypothetical protein
MSAGTKYHHNLLMTVSKITALCLFMFRANGDSDGGEMIIKFSGFERGSATEIGDAYKFSGGYKHTRPLGLQSACVHLFTMKAVWKDTVIGITCL